MVFGRAKVRIEKLFLIENLKTRMLLIKSVWSMEMYAVDKHLVKLPGNPRWPPNGTTYMAPNTLACGGTTRLLYHVSLNVLWAS